MTACSAKSSPGRSRRSPWPRVNGRTRSTTSHRRRRCTSSSSPREHITSADEIASSHGGIVDDLVLLAQEVADLEGIRESGYRLVFNVGRDGQMTVPHLHMHVLGGRRLEWPPG